MSISQPAQITVPFAASGLKNAIPAVSDPINGKAGYDQGFTAINMTPKTAGGIPPFGQDFNGIFYDVTLAIQYLEAGGTFPFNLTYATTIGGYPKGAIVSRANGDGVWVNLVANNSTNPDMGGAGWRPGDSGGVVGGIRNLKMSVTAASASAVITADLVEVMTALNGVTYALPSFSKTINLAVTGAGGMDTGTAPANGFVAVYAIYNPTTGASALLAVNATSSVAPEVYGGANMPSGYTASALISVKPTNASSQFTIGIQIDRFVSTSVVAISTTTTSAGATLSLASAVPLNARTIDGGLQISGATANGGAICTVSPSSILNATAKIFAGYIITGIQINHSFSNLPLVTPQSIWYSYTNAASTATFATTITGYTF